MSYLRIPSALFAATAAVGAAALLAGCGGGTTSSNPPAPTAKPSPSVSAAASVASLPPSQILSKALAAAEASGSVHFAGTARSNSGTNTYDQNAASTVGNQVIVSSGGQRVTIRVVAGVGYLRANATALAQLFKGAAVSPLVGRWIATRSGDPGYQDITEGVTLASMLTEFTPAGTLTKTGPLTVDGQSVIGIKGKSPANGPVPQGQPVTLYVTATGQPLPVSFQGGVGTDQASVAFTNWGETVNTVAPAHSLPITSVTSG